MSSVQLYDSIGVTYTVTRRTEPRIAARIWAALGDARTVLNVGAGTGSYEPSDRDVTAVEPSAVMRAQRPAGAAPCVDANAESLPFEDQTFDVAMALSTVHHWQDPIAGLREMRRVARRVVVFTHDASEAGWRRRFWLTRDYLPEVAEFSLGRPSLTEQAGAIGAAWNRCLFRGTALTASSRPTGADPRHTSTTTYVAVYRCGPESDRRPSSAQCAASVMTLSQAGGPNATATSSPSMRRSSEFACS